METVIFKSNSKKDMDLLVSLAKKIGIDVKKVASKKNANDKNDPAYELKVERNLGRMIEDGMKSGVANKAEVMKVINQWK